LIFVNGLSLGLSAGLVSACLPVFHCRVAFVNPIFLDSLSVSGLRLSEETQSGTRMSWIRKVGHTLIFLKVILDSLHGHMCLKDEDGLV
jgi:hypothetical protein